MAGSLVRRAITPLPSTWSVIRAAVRRFQAAAVGLWQRARRFMGAMWARRPSAAAALALPLARRYSAWFAAQTDYVQVALLAFSLAMALLLAVAAGYVGVRMPAVRAAKAQEPPTPTLASVLYAWLEKRPARPATGCGPFVPPALCTQRLAADAEKWQADFSAYQAGLQSRQYYAVWTRDGKDFPAYNSETGAFTFTLALEGKPQGPEKTCVPFRVIAQMPSGITTGPWPDQSAPPKPPANPLQRLREIGAKAKPFPHPCLRTPEWTAWARVEPETAQAWVDRAKDQGWKLEMYFRLDRAESLLLPNWDDDARLTDADFLQEQRIWLWVDAVRLVIGDLVACEWR